MAIANDLNTIFESRHNAFEVVYGQLTNSDLHRIVEELSNILYPIKFDN